MVKNIVFITTGFSLILPSLVNHKFVNLIGIIDYNEIDIQCKEYAHENSIPFYVYKQLDELRTILKLLAPEILVIYKMPFLLSEEDISLYKNGAINIHPSLLPEYKGLNPWFWIYYNMELYSGVTIHKVDKFADHGDILANDYIPITIGISLNELRNLVEQKAIVLLNHIFKEWDLIQPTPQPRTLNNNRNKGNINIAELINPHHIVGLRLWHILKGFPSFLALLCKDVEDKKYEIGCFILAFSSPDQIGTLITTDKMTRYICKDGFIEVILTKDIK